MSARAKSTLGAGLAVAALLVMPGCTGFVGELARGFTPEGVHPISDVPRCPLERTVAAPTDTWTPAGPPGASVRALLALGQGTLLVGTGTSRSAGLFSTRGGGLFRSTDDGRTVTRVQALADSQVNALVATSAGVVYAAVGSAFGAGADGVWRSSDRGATFTRADQGLHTGARVYALAVAAGATERVYALVLGTAAAPGAAVTSLYRKDGAGDWALVDGIGLDPDPGGPLGAIAADPAEPDRLYAADGARVYVSEDAGGSFTALSMGYLGNPRHLLVPSPGRLLLGTRGDGLFESTDNGATWVVRSAAKAGVQKGVHDVVLDRQGRVLAATEGAGLQRLVGPDVATVGTCLIDTVALSVAAAPDADLVWVGTNGGLFVSSDGGERFEAAGQGLDELLAQVTVVALDGQPTAFLLSAGGLYSYATATGRWERQGDWTDSVAFAGLAMNPEGTLGYLAIDEELFPGRYDVPGGLWRWRRSERLVEPVAELEANVGAVRLDPSQAGTAFAYQRGGALQSQRARTGVYLERAASPGFTQTAMVSEHLEDTSTFRFAPLAVAGDGTVYSGMRLADGTPALFRSGDDGASFTQAWSQPGWIATGVYANAAGEVFLTGWLQLVGIQKSVDQGATFAPADQGLTGFAQFVYGLGFDGTGGLVAATEAGVHYAPAGQPFTALNQGLPADTIAWSVAVLPAQPRPIVLAGTSRGVFWRTLP